MYLYFRIQINCTVKDGKYKYKQHGVIYNDKTRRSESVTEA